MDAATVTTHGEQARALARTHAALVSDRSIQWSLPAYEPPKPPTWLKPIAEFLKAAAPYVGYLFWGLVIAGLLVIAFLVARELIGARSIRPRAVDVDEAPEWQPEAAAARTLLSEADELAEAGRYDEAVRLLLRRSVEDIGARLPRFLRPSLTARDIAAATALPARARAAFGTMAVVTEAAVFARADVDADGWQRARAAYADFALGRSWKAVPA